MHKTLVTPSGNDEPEGGAQLTLAPGQLSITVGSAKFTTGEHCPGEAVTDTLAGHKTAMRSRSLTVTVNEQVAVAPPASVAIQVTGVVPIAKLEPLGGEQTTLKTGQLSATGRKKFTVPVQLPGSFTCKTLPGQLIRGGGLVAIVVAVATLLAVLESEVEELKTVAVLPMAVPLATEQFTRASIVITADAPGASEAKVIVRVLPDPPHTPPPVESHETKDRLAESTSVTVTDVAAAGPALLTTTIFVT